MIQRSLIQWYIISVWQSNKEWLINPKFIFGAEFNKYLVYFRVRNSNIKVFIVLIADAFNFSSTIVIFGSLSHNTGFGKSIFYLWTWSALILRGKDLIESWCNFYYYFMYKFSYLLSDGGHYATTTFLAKLWRWIFF